MKETFRSVCDPNDARQDFLFLIWSLTLLPGSPRAPSAPWQQISANVISSWQRTFITSHYEMCHVPIDLLLFVLHLISLTFSPAAPLGPGKPWWQKGKTSFASLSLPINNSATMQRAWKRTLIWFNTPVCHSLLNLLLLRGPASPSHPVKKNIQITAHDPPQENKGMSTDELISIKKNWSNSALLTLAPVSPAGPRSPCKQTHRFTEFYKSHRLFWESCLIIWLTVNKSCILQRRVQSVTFTVEILLICFLGWSVANIASQLRLVEK